MAIHDPFLATGCLGHCVSVQDDYRRGKKTGKEETTLDILKKRYAKGEISKAEFEEKKKDIE